MSATVEQYEVVTTATSHAGTRFEIIRRSNGTYVIGVVGRPIEAFYWWPGELDRCTRVFEQMMGEEPEVALAA